ncbi:MAG: TonB-dependent receptor [Steroidobacteraceae bacterium]
MSSLCLVALLCTPALSAQNAPAPASTGQAEDSGALQEIVVTAQRRAENLQDVPISVTALSPDVLQAAGVESQIQLPRLTPNMQINASSVFVSPYLRGVGTQFANAGLETSVAVYFDDSYISRANFGMLTFSDIERIEVLKGPQGTLYGRNATGGAVRIITKDPVNHLEANASLTTGRYDRFMGNGMLNVPLGDKVSGRFTFTRDTRNNFVRNETPGENGRGDRSNTMYTAKLLFAPSDSFSVKLSGDYFYKKDQEGQAGFLALTNSAPGQTGIALGGQPHSSFYSTTEDFGDSLVFKEKNWGTGLRADWTLDWVTLSSKSNYRYSSDKSGGDLDTVGIPLLNAATFPAVTRSFSQEFQAVSNASGPIEWIAGLYYIHEEARHKFGIFGAAMDATFGVPSGPRVGELDGGVVFGSDAKVETDSFAPYVQATYAFNPMWDLTLGARYTIEDKKLKYHEVFVTGVGPDPLILVDEPGRKVDFEEFTPKATVSFKPHDGLMFYGTYSRGFKSGGFNSVAFVVADAVQPEQLNAYELGWKSQTDRMRFNGAAFYYDYKDLTVQHVDPNSGANVTENAANAELYGLEADITFAASSQLEFGAGAGYLHSKYKGYVGDRLVLGATTPACQTNPAACVGFVPVQTDFSGNPLTVAPEFTGYVRAQYDQPLGDLGALALSAIVNYTDEFFWDAAGDVREPSKTLLSAAATWSSSDERYEVGVFGDNLLDEKYTTAKVLTAQGGFYSPALPRTWGLRAGVHFR